MAELTARFKMIDEISDKLGSIADSGQDMVSQFEQAGDAANAAFEGISSGIAGVASAATAVDGVAVSVESIQDATSSAASSADELAGSIDGYGSAAQEAASQTDYWTTAVENYDKSALEAIYSTEELVEMGLKSADALQEQEQMFETCDRAARELSMSLEATTEIESELSEAMSEAAEMAAQIADNDSIAAETKAELAQASEEAAEAMTQLTAAQEEANAAMENYDAVMMSGTDDLAELEAAAERAGHAAENLAEANGRATEATEQLSQATEDATAAAEESGQTGVDAIQSIGNALVAAGITTMVKEAAEAVYDLADAFSEAESIVVQATGATGDTLNGLTESMMNAYAANKFGDLKNTAGAVGELNTRLGYTGEILTDTTGLFLDFAAVTGGNAASSVRNVTQLMNQWNVPATEMESVLDRLTYAGQASGIGVDTLTQQLTSNKAILDQLGYSLNEAIAMFMNFELAGTSSTQVMTGFRKALASGDISSLAELNNVFDQIASGAMSAAEASELFGTRAGPAIVNAVQSGVMSIDGLVAALESADGTLEKTATAAQTLDQKWSQAGNNIKSAFTTALQPAVDGLSSALAGMVNGIGTFLNEHQNVTKVITALGVGLGVVVAGIAGVTFATTVAIPAITAFGVALNAALGPIGWIALGIAGVVAAGTALAAMFSSVNDETAGMTATTREQYYELESLTSEYEEACSKYGETSEEALRLKYQVDELSSSFEANRQTLEEFNAEVDSLCSSVDELWQSFDEGMRDINSEEQGSLALIQRFSDLANQANLTGAQEQELDAITRKLSDAYPELSAQYVKGTTNAKDYAASMKSLCEQQAEQQRQEQAQDTYVEALQKRAELQTELEKAQANYNAELEAHGMVLDEVTGKYSNGIYTADSPWASWTTDLDDYSSALDDVNARIEENEAGIAEIEAQWSAVAEAQQAALEGASTSAEAVSAVWDMYEGKIQNLCAAYDQAYSAALSSFDGQFGLFDQAQANMDATVASAQAAMESQLAYWDSYAANVETLKSQSAESLGTTQENYDALMTFIQSGSEEAAGLAQSMVDNINSGNEEAVGALANTVADVQAKKEEAASAIADWQTDFSSQLQGLEQEMSSALEGLKLSDEAQAAAQETISAYVNQIQAGSGEAVAAAQEVTQQIQEALSGQNGGENKIEIGFEVNSEAVDNWQPPEKPDGKAVYEPQTTAIDNWQPPEKTGGKAEYTVNSATVDGWTPPNKTATAEYTVVSSNVDSYKPADKTAKAEYLLNSAQVDSYTPQDKSATASYELNSSAVDNWNPPNKTATVTYNIVTNGTIPGHAKGTTDAENVFIAGENGPELIARRTAAYATGTTDSADYFIAGENGPELIVGERGSTVFPTEETNRLINALNDRQTQQILPTVEPGDTVRRRDTFTNEKHIVLEINGNGAIEVGGSGAADKSTILEVLTDHIKPVLMKIIQSEIYEEGALSYDY